MDAVKLDSPQDIVVQLPAIFGFRPCRSLVVATVRDRTLGAVLRVDLWPTPELIDQLIGVVVHQDPDAVIAVIVDEDIQTGKARALMASLRSGLADVGVVVAGAVAVDSITAGARWSCVFDDCGDSGVIGDPAASLLSVAAVVAGRAVFDSRNQFVALVDQDVAKAARLAPLLNARAGAYRVEADDACRRVVPAVLAAVEGLAGGVTPDEQTLVELAVPLVDLRVRDMLLSTAVSAEGVYFEQLWMLMARSLPSPYRSEALAVLGFSSYVRGDGTLAGVALKAALVETPQHRLAGLLNAALQGGLARDQVWQLADVGFAIADEIGVVLPDRATGTYPISV